MGGERWKLDGPHRAAPQARWLPRIARRAFCTQLVGWAGLTDIVQAQPAKVPRLGILWHADSPEGEGPMYSAVHTGLRERGWIEGRNIVIDQRFAEEKPELFCSLAAELVALKPDVLLSTIAQSVLLRAPKR